jgi:hypothetical protein
MGNDLALGSTLVLVKNLRSRRKVLLSCGASAVLLFTAINLPLRATLRVVPMRIRANSNHAVGKGAKSTWRSSNKRYCASQLDAPAWRNSPRDQRPRQVGLLSCITISSAALGDGLHRVQRYSPIANASFCRPAHSVWLQPTLRLNFSRSALASTKSCVSKPSVNCS